MLTNLETRLRHKAINGWPLFLLFSIPISVAVLIKMLATDLSVGEGISSMIGYSVGLPFPSSFWPLELRRLTPYFLTYSLRG